LALSDPALAGRLAARAAKAAQEVEAQTL
jgi:hypothetical protein